MSNVQLFYFHAKKYHLTTTYGQSEEFDRALPALLGNIAEMTYYKRYTVTHDNGKHDIIEMERPNIDGKIERHTYKVVGYVPFRER